MEIYRIQDLSFSYPKVERDVLSNINLKLYSGEFVTLCGKSGSGKSTLLRHLKTMLTPYGDGKGKIYFCGKPLEEVNNRTQVSQIGYVLQSPDNQIVTDKVWHELAFGLESLGCDSTTIRLRVAEMASYFGIHNWFHKKVTELSGGQKQILNLAAIMTMQPLVLILDEPTSQLDPIAATEFLDMVKRINRELGITIIMTEHRLEEAIPLSDRLIVIDQGKIVADGSPKEVGANLKAEDHPMFYAMTSAMQIYAAVEKGSTWPVTVKEGRNWIDEFAGDKAIPRISSEKDVNPSKNENIVVELKDCWFKYEKNLPPVIKDLSLAVKRGEFYCIVGGNGTGKTTALSLISGINKPYRGKILIHGKDISRMKAKERYTNNLGVLPQNPQTLFVKKTLELDLHEILSSKRWSKEKKNRKIKEVAEITELTSLLSMHPYDLSGGEQQRAALAKILLLEPQILLLDEPTKGMDGHFKKKFGSLLKNLTDRGVTIVMVSHDIEFCAKYADTTALFFDGSIITANPTKQFFAGNSFYTTQANRIVRHMCPEAITIEDVIYLCRQMG